MLCFTYYTRSIYIDYIKVHCCTIIYDMYSYKVLVYMMYAQVCIYVYVCVVLCFVYIHMYYVYIIILYLWYLYILLFCISGTMYMYIYRYVYIHIYSLVHRLGASYMYTTPAANVHRIVRVQTPFVFSFGTFFFYAHTH